MTSALAKYTASNIATGDDSPRESAVLVLNDPWAIPCPQDPIEAATPQPRRPVTRLTFAVCLPVLIRQRYGSLLINRFKALIEGTPMPTLVFRHVGNSAYSVCGLYRVRELRTGLFIAERTWLPYEKPAHLYAKAWCFVGFSKNEQHAKTLCEQTEAKLQKKPPSSKRSTHTQTGLNAQHDLLTTHKGN
ncbi:hypothetical protein [Alcanivorax sp.]|uniref:hypothetical protein n=1 Tax=Alcanivorax sp. TaxID=1872427 RepID=UPI000C406F16|nr:hypothetical protein [Alcanivorax sp.]MBQ26082.1 hypothetical protein [Alcanivorax sp.]